MNLNRFMNKKVLVRTLSAGVHFGILVEKEDRELRLLNTRRIWSWSGALSLSEIASTGINMKESKISVCIEEILLPEYTELLPLTSHLVELIEYPKETVEI